MRGITFKIGNEYNNYLYQMFDNIDLSDFIWNICDDEILYKEKNNEIDMSIFHNDIMNGKDFLICIKKEMYYIVYADIKAFKHKSQVTNILTYEDFLKSNCEIALFCTDTINVELYCKNKTLLEKIIENCKLFHDFEIITIKNDDRSSFRL